MARQEKGLKTGFVIKLSDETVQKLVEEESQAKTQVVEVVKSESDNKYSNKDDEKLTCKSENNSKSEVSSPPESDKKDQNSQTVNDQDKSDKSNETDKDTSKAESTWGDYAPYITYEGEEAIYTDPSNHQKYIWSTESNSWTLKPGQEVQGREYSYEDDTHIYTEADGSKFFWDVDKKAWIPKVDDDFLALYQMSYGFVDNKAEETDKSKVEEKKKEQKKADAAAAAASGVKRKAEPQWFQPSEETNTKVYVSNLPLDLTEEEFVNFMQKCGLVERDPSSQKMKVKLYKDKEQDCFKGDALCTYIKIESVDLALKLLDGSDFKGNKIKVERASFQMKGEYNPALKPKKKKKKELEKLKKMQQKLFDWRPEKFIGERSKHERVVIVKNLFHPTDFDQEVQLILDYQQDMRDECGKCGEVRKVVIYDRHPEGVAQITMKEPEMADAVVELINGRWFGKRQITAEIWDGRTKYRIAETDSEISKRINKWDEFLEGKEGDSKKNGSKESAEGKKKEQSSEITDIKSVDNIEMKDATENVSGDSKKEAASETTKVVEDVKQSD